MSKEIIYVGIARMHLGIGFYSRLLIMITRFNRFDINSGKDLKITTLQYTINGA